MDRQLDVLYDEHIVGLQTVSNMATLLVSVGVGLVLNHRACERQ